MSTGENFKVYFKVKVYNFKDFLFVLFKFYKNLKFCFLDLFLLVIYFFKNPYRISRKFLENMHHEKIHVYGETPLLTFEKIAKNFEITSEDKVIELGSGRGRTSFWLSSFIKCQVVSIEWIPFFVKAAQFTAKLFKEKNVAFLKADMFKVSFLDASLVYLYGSCLEDEEIIRLTQKFKKNENLKIITISYPLSDYDSSYTHLKSLNVSFPWGETTCYLNVKKV
jgi:hypothetical protein